MMKLRVRTLAVLTCALAALLYSVLQLHAQAISQTRASSPTSAPITISLDEAIHRAQQSQPALAAARGNARSVAIDSYLAKAALLPSATYENSMLYTQPNGEFIASGQGGGKEPAPIFIANNAIHEYTSQAAITETIGLKELANVKVANANAAMASAELEIARRGLVATVVGLYYSIADAETKEHLMADALHVAQDFTGLTQKREQAREVAHADVVKAQLQQQQRQRDLLDAKVAEENARLNLAVLLFPDPRTPYTTEPAPSVQQLPLREDVYAQASAKNPELRSAMAALKASDAQVDAARAAYVPDLTFNFNYGIDAPQFAKRSPDGVPNLGYSITGTVNLPVWDWFSTQKRIKQSEIRRSVAQTTLTNAQRQLIAGLDEAYTEASTAHEELDLLNQSVNTAADNLRLTNLRYTAGEALALEVVDAQNSYIAAQTAQADGVLRYETALANLQILTGKL